MLVLISDVHLTDGSSGGTISSDAFRILRKQLCNLSYAASFRRDGTYSPVEELDLVLLGDILDVIRSSEWLARGNLVRPWSDVNDPAFSQKVEAITRGILDHNADSLAVLRSISQGQKVTVPATVGPDATPGAEAEQRSEGRVPVRVHIHYQVGNHDWFYHLPGSDFNRIRASIVNAMGLANDSNAPFPHEPQESSALMSAYEDHRVFARHGDQYDPFNFERDRNASSLGDAVVVELLNSFPAEVEVRMGSDLPKACTAGLRELDNVRPLPLIPVWVDGLLRHTCPDSEQVKAVKKIWDDTVDRFLQNPFVRDRNSPWNPFDNVDKLEYALKFSRGVSLQALSKLAAWVVHRSQGVEGPFFQYALRERAYRNRTATHIVYGHTHHHEIVPLDRSYSDCGPLKQLYVNTGTWRRVYELAQGNPAEQEFIGYNVMTYVTFFKGDERHGRSFETWSGALACD